MNNENNTNNTFTILLLNRIKEYFETNEIKKLTNILEGKSNLSLRIIDWFVTNYAKKYNVSYVLKKNIEKEKDKIINEIIYTYDNDNNVDNQYSLTIPFDDFNKDNSVDIDNIVYNNLVNNYISNENNELDIEVKYVKFIVFNEYRGQLKAFTKKYFDSFCRGERIIYDNHNNKFETTLGQLNFFRWAIENELLTYIEKNYDKIQNDMNESIKKKKSNKSVNKIKEKTQQQQTKNNIYTKLNQKIIVPFIKENQKIVVRFN
jgi:hypothetical protein